MLRYPAAIGRMVGFTKLRDDLHGKWLQQMLLSDEDMTLLAHRGSYKTTCLSLALASMLLLFPDKNIIFLRKTDDDVVEVIHQVAIILAHKVYSDLSIAIHGRPVSLVRENSTEITTNVYASPRGAVQLLGIGLGGSITGKHADIIVTDDIINLNDRRSKAERDRTRTAYQELQNIKNPGGRIINTGTPWHKDDAFSLMPPPTVYDCYTTGLLSTAQIEVLKKSMEPSLFAANYELRHIASEGALFATLPDTTDDTTRLRDGVAHVDAAYGGEDFTALTCGKRGGDTLYLYGRLWRAHVDTVMDAIEAECDRLMCAPIWCETNGDKSYLSRELRRRGLETHPYHEKQNKYFKIATFLRKWWGNVVFVAGTDPAYIAQIMDYTEQATHDDAPDSAACVCRILDRRE